MYKPHTVCRACGYGAPLSRAERAGASAHWDEAGGKFVPAKPPDRLIPVLDLGIQPLANDFCFSGEERSGYAPLQVLFCPRCTLAQLSVVVQPDILYANDYPYVTSPSQTMRAHFERLLADIGCEQQPGSVVEIGSNDGLFLKFLGEHDYANRVGIEPAKNLADAASKSGVPTLNSFFCERAALTARELAGSVDLLVSRHVFCHIDDWRGFVTTLGFIAGKDTLICIEVPYVVDQLNGGSWDQVYHEHLSYLSITAVKALLNGSNYHLHRICHYPIHSGCVVLMIRRNDSLAPVHPSVQSYLTSEHVTVEWWQKFAEESSLQISQLGNTVRELVAAGKRVCGWGASAKSTVWLNACKFTRKEISYVMDSTAQKVGTNSPGTDIPIVNEGTHLMDGPDYVVLFAWNYATEIMTREKEHRKKDLEAACPGPHFKWIVPVPTVRIVDA